MRVLVTGAGGFAGRWLVSELSAHGHEVSTDRPDGRRIDITDGPAVRDLLRATAPDVVVHLAAVSSDRAAVADPEAAMRVNVGGTATLIDALAPGAAIVVVSSSEVYGDPHGSDPINERRRPAGTRPYALSKLGQEAVTSSLAPARGVRHLIVRPFNHTGPGQDRGFVVPAIVDRVVAARTSGATRIATGNIDVVRDLGDVRDTVRAYRLLAEGLAGGTIAPGSRINVATGHGARLRDVLDEIGRLAGHAVEAAPDPALVRTADPAVVIGDASELRRHTGWAPRIPLTQTLRDLLDGVDGADGVGTAPGQGVSATRRG